MSELKRHARAHTIETLGYPDEFFGEPNGFWMANYPLDYLRVQPPSDPTSDIAELARTAVRTWLSRGNSQTRTESEWESGWVVGTDHQQVPPPAKRLHTMASYSPSRPSMETDLVLSNIVQTQDCWSVYVKSGDHVTTYELVIDGLKIVKEPKLLESLLRRKTTLPDTPFVAPSGPVQNLTGALADQVKFRVAGMLRLPLDAFQSVTQRTLYGGLPRPFPTMDPTAPDLGSPGLPETTGTVSSSSTPSRLTETGTLSMFTPPKSMGAMMSPLSSPHYIPTPTAGLPGTPQLPSPMLQSVPVAPPTACGDAGPKPAAIGSTIPSMVAASSSTATDIKSRAARLLYGGGLPIFPPARRDWEKVAPITLQRSGRSFMWPPQNWRELNGDQRLLALEFVAMTLESADGSIPLITRSGLVDLYQVLALPGTKCTPLTGAELTAAKAKSYTYETVRLAAVTGEGDPEYLSALESMASRARRPDWLLQQIQHVPMRLS